jgi:uncharacterized protein
MDISRIDIEELKRTKELKIITNIEIKDLDLESLRFLEDINVDLILKDVDNIFNIKGKIVASIELECNRCLKYFPYRLGIFVDNNFIKEEDTSKREGCIELKEKDIEHLSFKGEFLDILKYIREEILLNLPDYPLCKDDCLGLCPSCGIDLNYLNCNCKEEKQSPFLILNKLINREES